MRGGRFLLEERTFSHVPLSPPRVTSLTGATGRQAAVWFADIVGYSSLAFHDEVSAHELVNVLETLAGEIIEQNGGRLVKSLEDGVMAEFASVNSAVDSALALEQRFAERAGSHVSGARLRVGIHLGEVVPSVTGDICGDGVNTAAHLQQEAGPGQVVVSEDVRRALHQHSEYRFTLLRQRRLKGLASAVRAFRVDSGALRRHLSCIMFTDTVGYSALSQTDERRALRMLGEQRELLRPILEQHRGREIKTTGDGFLVEFKSAVRAAECAIAMQKAVTDWNAEAPENRHFHIRIGLHLGDVVVEDGDVYGDSVNIASRVEACAPPGGIAMTEAVAQQVGNKLDHAVVRIGPHKLKNIREPVSICRVALPWDQEARRLEGNSAAGGDPCRRSWQL